MAKPKRKATDNLKHRKQPRVRAEIIDYDYVDKLSPEDQKWLGKFTDEYAGASIKVSAMGVPKKGSIHKTPDHVKSVRDANNHRNNDVYGANRANGLLFDVDSKIDTNDGWYITNPEYTEDSVISKLDNREDGEELSFMEYVECRGNMLEARVSELDVFYQRQLGYSSDDYFILIIIYNSGEISKRKFEKLSRCNYSLKKFIQDSEFFKSKNKSADKT